MYLNCIIPYQSNDFSNIAPRADFIEYCNDLQYATGGVIKKLFLTNQFGFSFSQLLDQFILEYPNALDYFEEAGYCFIIHASCEYDPVYSHIGVYLAEQYDIRCEMIDIAEQGVLSLVTALHILRTLFSNHKMQYAIILGFDQRNIPVVANPNIILPDFNGVSIFSLSRTFDYCVANIACIHAELTSVADNRFMPLALQLKQQYQTDSEADVFCYMLTTRKDANPFFQTQSFLGLSVCRVEYGLGPLFHFLDQLQQEAQSHVAGTLYILLIEDEQLDEQGMVVLRKGL